MGINSTVLEPLLDITGPFQYGRQQSDLLLQGLLMYNCLIVKFF